MLAASATATALAVVPFDVELPVRVPAAERRCGTPLAAAWRSSTDRVAVYLHPGADESDRAAVLDALEASRGLGPIAYVDQQEAYEEFRRMFADDPELVGSVDVADLPPSYRAEADSKADAIAVERALRDAPGVRDVVVVDDPLEVVRTRCASRGRWRLALAAGVLAATLAGAFVLARAGRQPPAPPGPPAP